MRSVSSQVTRPRIYVLSILALSIACGIFQAYVRGQGKDLRIVTVPSIFLYAILFFSWCKADAAHRGIEPPDGAPLLVAMLALVGVPYYGDRALPWRRASLALLGAVCVLVLMIALTRVSDWLTTRSIAS